MQGLTKRMIRCISLMAFMSMGAFFARVRTVQSEREFDQQLNRSRLMVALFYEGRSHREGSSRQSKMGPLFRMYESVSSKKMYDDADIVFSKIDVKNRAVGDVMRKYSLSSIPCFVLFVKGKPVMTDHNEIAQLIGFVSEDELHHFIKTYCINDIQAVVNTKERNRKERFVKSQEESDPYFYPAVYYAPEYDFSWQKPLKYDAEGNEVN